MEIIAHNADLAGVFEILIDTYKIVPRKRVNNYCTITFMMMQHARFIPARKRFEFLQWLENDVGVLRNIEVVRAYQEIEDELRELSARVIQKHWITCVSDPHYYVCRRRLTREFVELSNTFEC
jgi:hypothetical protein